MARSTRRVNRRTTRGKEVPWLGVCLIITALSCGGALAYFYLTTTPEPTLDQATLCPLDGSHSATVVLIDSTDDLPTITKREVLTTLTDLAETIAPYGLLELRNLDPQSRGSKILFSKCNPGNGKGISEWTGNPEMAKRRWRSEFQKPLSEALDGSMRANNKSDVSPIMYAIQGIAIDRFTSRAAGEMPKNLIIVSDMIEHNPPDYTQYQSDFSFEKFKRSAAYLKTRTDLKGADVSVFFVQRLTRKSPNINALADFWTEWFSDNKAKLRKLTRLQGAG